MRLDVNIMNIMVIVLTTFTISYLLMFLVKKLAIYLGAIDYPKENRRIHKQPTPRMGALAIFISFLMGYMIFGTASVQMNSILIGSFLLIMTGIIDDIKEIPNRYKFVVQFIAAVIAVFYGGFLLQNISAFGFEIDFGLYAYPITLFFILGAINCINLIDGMDGLSSGICSIYFLTVGIIAVTLTKNAGLDVLLSFVTLGATLGYLKHNYYPAKIFMGDGGSMFLGYIISIIALIGYKNVTFTSFIVPVVLLLIPIIDTLLAILRRTLKKESIMHADKEHLHYQLLNRNNSTPKTVLTIYLIDILLACISVFYVLKKEKLAIPVYIVLMLLLIVLITKTNILIDWNKRKKKKKSIRKSKSLKFI